MRKPLSVSSAIAIAVAVMLTPFARGDNLIVQLNTFYQSPQDYEINQFLRTVTIKSAISAQHYRIEARDPADPDGLGSINLIKTVPNVNSLKLEVRGETQNYGARDIRSIRIPTHETLFSEYTWIRIKGDLGVDGNDDADNIKLIQVEGRLLGHLIADTVSSPGSITINGTGLHTGSIAVESLTVPFAGTVLINGPLSGGLSFDHNMTGTVTINGDLTGMVLVRNLLTGSITINGDVEASSGGVWIHQMMAGSSFTCDDMDKQSVGLGRGGLSLRWVDDNGLDGQKHRGNIFINGTLRGTVRSRAKCGVVFEVGAVDAPYDAVATHMGGISAFGGYEAISSITVHGDFLEGAIGYQRNAFTNVQSWIADVTIEGDMGAPGKVAELTTWLSTETSKKINLV